MNSKLTIRRARRDELDSVMRLFERRVEWLRARGSSQWASYSAWRPTMKLRIESGETRVVCGPKGILLGTVTVKLSGESAFWREHELKARDALYVSRLATDVDAAGLNLGRLLLDWAIDHAFEQGKMYARLDAWQSATGLHRFYLENGWRHLRTMDVPGRNSGALFETIARPVPAVRGLNSAHSHRKRGSIESLHDLIYLHGMAPKKIRSWRIAACDRYLAEVLNVGRIDESETAPICKIAGVPSGLHTLSAIGGRLTDGGFSKVDIHHLDSSGPLVAGDATSKVPPRHVALSTAGKALAAR